MDAWSLSVAAPKAARVSQLELRLALDLNWKVLPPILRSTSNLSPTGQHDHNRRSLAGDESEGLGGAGKKVVGVVCLSRRFTVHHRLLKSHEYEQVFNATAAQRGGAGLAPLVRGYQFSHGGVMVRARRNGGDLPRLGLIISKKSIKRAIDRNLVKRIARESFRLCQARLGGLDVVVMSRAGLGELSRPALRAVLDKHWDGLARWRGRGKEA